MPQTSKRRTPHRRRPGVLPAERSAFIGPWLDRLAFGLLAAVVIARLMMLETLRNALAVSPAHRRCRPGRGRRRGWCSTCSRACPRCSCSHDGGWSRIAAPGLRLSWSMLPMALLGGGRCSSTVWATDKFAALVSSIHLCAAFADALGWRSARPARGCGCGCWRASASAAARCWWRTASTSSRWSVPPLQQEWKAARRRDPPPARIEPGSFEALQFTNKVLRGELMGFNTSPNAYAALVVVTMVVSLGVVIDRWSRRRMPDGRASPGATLTAVLVGLFVILLPAALDDVLGPEPTGVRDDRPGAGGARRGRADARLDGTALATAVYRRGRGGRAGCGGRSRDMGFATARSSRTA